MRCKQKITTLDQNLESHSCGSSLDYRVEDVGCCVCASWLATADEESSLVTPFVLGLYGILRRVFFAMSVSVLPGSVSTLFSLIQ